MTYLPSRPGHRGWFSAALIAAIAGSSAGCGLISSDVVDFELNLPKKQFSIDTAGWQVDPVAADLLLQTSCASVPSVCNTAAQSACEMNCSGTCAADQFCELQLDVSLYQPVNLLAEAPELKSIDDQPVIKVTVDSMTYDIEVNTLDVATPELTLYVAPMSVMSPTDAQALAIGTIPPVPAGETIRGRVVEFTPDGKARLASIMSTFKTPFNVLVGSSLTVTGELPTGKLDAVVSIRGRAGL